MKNIAGNEAPAVIERIFTHLGLSAQPLPRSPARRLDLSLGGGLLRGGEILTLLTVGGAGDAFGLMQKGGLNFRIPLPRRLTVWLTGDE